MRRLLRGTVVVAVTVGTLTLPGLPASAGHSQEVAIDLRPGVTDNAVNLNGRAGLPVAILTTPSFDATAVDPLTVCFGDAENATQRDCTEAHGTGHREDADGDGDTDLLLHYDAEQAGLDAGDTRACLEGRTIAGGAIHGCDGVAVRNGTPEADLPDLTPPVTASPATAGAGDSVTWTATLTNEGIGAITFAPGTNVLRLTVPASLGAPATAAPAGFTCPAASATTFRCVNDDPFTLLAGGTVAFPVSGAMPSLPGPVTVTAVADPNGVVVESDETDNTRAATAVVDPANLTTTLTVSPAALAPGEGLTLTATVRNTGTVAAFLPAGTTALRFELPGTFAAGTAAAPSGFACSGVACATTADRVLPVGGDFVFTLAATAATAPGEYAAAAKADPNGVVDESDEADNRATADLLVEPANLVTTATTLTDPVSPGGAVQWTSDLVNLGPGKVRIPAGTRAISFTFSEALSGVSVTAPSGYTCAGVSATEHACETTAPTTLLAGDRATFAVHAVAPANPGDLTMTATADPLGLVTEADETDNATAATLDVASVNLTVTAAPRANPVDALASTQWDATITNAGGALDVASGTHLFRFSWPAGFTNIAVSTPAGYSCFIVSAQTADCAATAALTIPAGGTVPVQVFGTSPRQPGPLSLTFTVDPLAVVAESNEADNVAVATTTVQPPDLSATVTVTPDPGQAGFSTTWAARITNDGPSNLRLTTGMTPFRVLVPSGMTNLAISTPAGFTCFLSSTLVVDCTTTTTTNIPAGGHVDVSFFGTAPRDPGTISLTYQLDPLGAIPEGDETDNEVTTSLLVRGPDLSVTLDVTPDPVNAGHSSTWSSRITNDGPSRARIPNGTTLIRWNVPTGMTNLAVSTPTGFTCFISATNVVDCTTTTSLILDVGASYDVSFFGTAPRQLAPLTMTITADPLGGVPEEDESNNAATTTVDVQGPDFSVTLTPSADPVDAAHSVQWTAVVTNDGPAPVRIATGTTFVRFDVPAGLTNLAVSTPTGYTCFIAATNVVECDTSTLQTLAAGAAHTVTFFGTAPRTPGPLTMTVTVDPDGAIPEEDEGDNTVSSTVTVQPPDLTAAVTPDPPTVTAGSPASWTVELGNAGPARARLGSSIVGLRVVVPGDLAGPAVSAPGWTCTAVDATTFDCRPDVTTTIPVGAGVTFDVTGTAAQPGALTVSATADPASMIPEQAESNNTASGVVTAT